MNGQSLNILSDNLQKLKQIFPELFTENNVDWEKLKAAFGSDINFANERYVLNWAGKADAFRTLQIPTTATLKPAQEESVNFDTTENVFIEGENLEVLKVLQKSYYSKIKCIIIDPPYNTGSDSFIYPDRFSEKKEEYLKRVGDVDEEGLLMKEGLFRKNSKESGHYHSNWLSMMYPRLFLAKNLLRDDGVIFVHIDDNEVHNLRLVMNEIFGEENFIANITVLCNPKGRSQDKYFASNHEYVLVCSKSNLPKGFFSIAKDDEQVIDEYPEEDEAGKYRLLELRNTHREFGRHNRKNLYYPFYVDKDGNVSFEAVENSKDIFPLWDDGYEGCWTWEKSKAEKELALLVAIKVKDRWKIYRKSYANGAERMLKTILLDNSFYTERGQKEFNQLFLTKDKIFQSPKSPSLLSQLIRTITKEEDIVLDFFGGSGTTAHAVLELNKEDGGNRKFILVQMPEPCDETSEAYKAGYKTIAEIAKERIRRVIKKISEQRHADAERSKAEASRKPSLFGVDPSSRHGSTSLTMTSGTQDDTKGMDLGFKVFKLVPSNFKIWRSAEITEENLESQLEAFVTPAKPAAQKQNMLYELMLKAGYTLTSSIEYVILANTNKRKVDSGVRRNDKDSKGNVMPANAGIQNAGYYSIADDELIIALDEMNEALIDAIIELKPKKVITLDSLFAENDQLKTNTVLQMKDAEIDFRTI